MMKNEFEISLMAGAARKLGIFGGTFDPPHISHTLACLYALETNDLDGILVLPCYRHPLGKDATPFEHRLALARLAMEGLGNRVEVLEIESEREEASYTIDTLRLLKERRPGVEFSLIIGSDILKETCLWKSFDEIQKMVRVIILPRSQADSPHEAHFFLPDISSTEIRRLLLSGKDASPFLSRRVLKYIHRHNLYIAP
ncbi:MAG: nicotinate (nicotinamide) nucleotide adenylyltransferase [Candidatus Sumerlaeota bacterium]|nr:nicotinate (nicotinamide) nucleotide adenylyltransferase [Candidatus Sumerlaeota bacterium]